jgi:hypothetical protein
MFGLFGKNEKEIQKLIDAKQYDELPTEVIDEIAKDIVLTTETSLSGYPWPSGSKSSPPNASSG